MNDVNKIVIIGRLTRDLGTDGREFGYLPNGTARASVSIAVNGAKKQGDQYIDEVSYFDVTLWGKTAENLKPYLLKGKQIAVEGHLKQDRWKDQQGNNKSKISIVAETVQLLGGKSGGENTGGASTGDSKQKSAPKANAHNCPRQQEFPEDIPWSDGEEIPF